MYDPLGVVDAADDASDAQVLVPQLEWRRRRGTLVDVLWATRNNHVIYEIPAHNALINNLHGTD